MTEQQEQPKSLELLEGLTEPQREAVAHIDGPLLVLAGAGSGKTRVITRRIAHLVQQVGLAPWNILSITFTNKAAGEMHERLTQVLTPRQANAVTVSTFHSLCARLLREFADRIGLPPGYSIYDSGDQTQAMKRVLQEMKISTSNFPPGKVLSAISQAKNELIDAKAYAASASEYFSRTVAGIYERYEKTLAKNNALDFDDLLIKTVQLFREHTDVVELLRERYQYLLIDEYQDTNHAQFLIANTLASQHRNICATGDPDQSIYGWRGADLRNILDFEEHYPDVKVVRLEQNYRSTKSILTVADTLIQCNKKRKHKRLWTENDQGDHARVITSFDEKHEADWVVEWITEQHKEHGTPWSDVAVFYRVNSLSRVIEDALRREGIPYQIARGTAFYDRKEVKDALAYLRVVVNPADEVNLFRIINTPARGISPNTIKAIQAYAVSTGQRACDILAQPGQVDTLNTRAISALHRFAQTVASWQQASLKPAVDETDNPGGLSLRGFVENVLRESGLENHFRNDKTDPEQERLMNLGELVSSVQQFEEQFDAEYEGDDPATINLKLTDYLEQVALVSDVDAVDTGQGAVTLMTLHAAKGLEFPTVAMIGLEEGLLPHSRALESDHEMEEERRLCFVGITRTQQNLALTSTRFRTVFGQTKTTVPSRFLDEIGSECVVREDNNFDTDDNDDLPTFRRESEPSGPWSKYPPGTLVRHDRFGLGRIVTINRSAASTRAKIEFTTAGQRTLILEYAGLEVVTDF